MIRIHLAAVMSLLFAILGGQVIAASTPDRLAQLGAGFCQALDSTPDDQQIDIIIDRGKRELGKHLSASSKPIEFRGRSVGVEVVIETSNGESLAVQAISPPIRPSRVVLVRYRKDTILNPELQFTYAEDCSLRQVWQQFFDADNKATHSQQLSPERYEPVGPQQWLNPPVPDLVPIQPARLRVAMIDSGVNYLLPEIANALARDRQGNLIGYDFWDMDSQPYDAHPTQSPFMIHRHGTRTASIVIDEAPGVAIVPYRYPRPDMNRMKALIEHAAGNNVRIIGMPLGGNRYQEWAAFQQAAIAHPQILFIASAGNNGRDIDLNGVYPAALEIDNMLVVTSSNDFVEPAERTNYGRISVDYLLPAEHISALDFDGTRQLVSGSSYAVSRLVALAARLLHRSPSLSTESLKKLIEEQSIRANTGKYVSTGYLGDLFATSATVDTTKLEVRQPATVPTSYKLPIDLFILNDNWIVDDILMAMESSNRIFEQCDLQIEPRYWRKVAATPYLQYLSTGNALTLRQKLPVHNLAVYFIDDTRMHPGFDAEAFGAGNTRNRPWLRNTLWITAATNDLDIALAHELFHILVNNGRHTTEKNNLMNDRTDRNNTLLTASQCEAAHSYATEAGLILENQESAQ